MYDGEELITRPEHGSAVKHFSETYDIESLTAKKCYSEAILCTLLSTAEFAPSIGCSLYQTKNFNYKIFTVML